MLAAEHADNPQYPASVRALLEEGIVLQFTKESDPRLGFKQWRIAFYACGANATSLCELCSTASAVMALPSSPVPANSVLLAVRQAAGQPG